MLYSGGYSTGEAKSTPIEPAPIQDKENCEVISNADSITLTTTFGRIVITMQEGGGKLELARWPA